MVIFSGKVVIVDELFDAFQILRTAGVGVQLLSNGSFAVGPV